VSFFEWLNQNVIPQITSLGLSERTVTLEVIGRKSSIPRRVTVATAQVDGSQYLVSVHGESNWVRNVRAANGEASIISGRRMPVRLIEIPLEDRPPVIQAYLSEGSFGRSAAEIARQFGVEPEPALSDIAPLAGRHPVFRIEHIG
jgi:deazaflavin-dependent oxidoreductase (nitroreductase family)